MKTQKPNVSMRIVTIMGDKTDMLHRVSTELVDEKTDCHDSYTIPVRQDRALPAACFRSPLTMDTLAVQLTIPPVGPVEDFHLQVGAPCRAHNPNVVRKVQRYIKKHLHVSSSIPV